MSLSLAELSRNSLKTRESVLEVPEAPPETQLVKLPAIPYAVVVPGAYSAVPPEGAVEARGCAAFVPAKRQE
jgi:hypothetical protein